MTTSYLFMVMYTASGLVAGHRQMPPSLTLTECREQAARMTVLQPFTGKTKRVTFACERRRTNPSVQTNVNLSSIQLQ